MAPQKTRDAIRPSVQDATLPIFLALLAFRIVNALSIRTFFQPDEYFQALEPAWRSAFGANSGAWITWEWREQLRSSTHPLMFAIVYSVASGLSNVLNLTPHSRAELLIAAPKVLQALFAATGDYFTWKLATKIYGPGHVSLAALALTVCSPWQWFCSVRTLSNSLEMTLTVFALYVWPWHWIVALRDTQETLSSIQGMTISLLAAASASVLRVTNTMIWATLNLHMLYSAGSMHKFFILINWAMVCGFAALFPSLLIDGIYYGDLVVPPFKFLYFNIVQSLAVFYGTNRSDYYFTEGLPLLLTTALPFAALGMWQALKAVPARRVDTAEYVELQKRALLATCVVTTVVALTCISHKEVRFIYPLLPCLHVLAAKPFATFFYPFPRPARRLRGLLLFLLLLVNILIAGYVSSVHQRGVIDVLDYLRHEQETRLESSRSPEMSVGFLMPCHSTPWRSHIVHRETSAWALSCEPPVNVPMDQRATYLDEADVFYANPEKWLETNMVTGPTEDDLKQSWPDYLVFFEQLEPTMSKVLQDRPYRECWRGFNTHFHDDSRRHGDVIVWCTQKA